MICECFDSRCRRRDQDAFDGSKGPMPLLGVPLIQRTVLTLRDAGITEMIVVVGFKGGLVKNHLGDGSKYGVKISYAVNDEYERENATSILKAEKLVNEKFLLVRALKENDYNGPLIIEAHSLNDLSENLNRLRNMLNTI